MSIFMHNLYAVYSKWRIVIRESMSFVHKYCLKNIFGPLANKTTLTNDVQKHIFCMQTHWFCIESHCDMYQYLGQLWETDSRSESLWEKTFQGDFCYNKINIFWKP